MAYGTKKPMEHEYDKLVDLSENQNFPNRARPADFPNIPGAYDPGATIGTKDKLVEMSTIQEYPRAAETGWDGKGAGIPVPADEGSHVRANFTPKRSEGDSTKPVEKMPMDYGVDLMDGQITCSKYKQTPVKEVPEDAVRIDEKF